MLSTYPVPGIVLSISFDPHNNPVKILTLISQLRNRSSKTLRDLPKEWQLQAAEPGFEPLGCTFRVFVLHLCSPSPPVDSSGHPQELQVFGQGSEVRDGQCEHRGRGAWFSAGVCQPGHTPSLGAVSAGLPSPRVEGLLGRALGRCGVETL